MIGGGGANQGPNMTTYHGHCRLTNGFARVDQEINQKLGEYRVTGGEVGWDQRYVTDVSGDGLERRWVEQTEVAGHAAGCRLDTAQLHIVPEHIDPRPRLRRCAGGYGENQCMCCESKHVHRGLALRRCQSEYSNASDLVR